MNEILKKSLIQRLKMSSVIFILIVLCLFYTANLGYSQDLSDLTLAFNLHLILIFILIIKLIHYVLTKRIRTNN